MSHELPERHDWIAVLGGPGNSAVLADHLRHAIDGMAAALFTFNDRLDLFFVSDSVATVLGVPRDEIVACRTVEDLLGRCQGLDRTAAEAITQAAAAGITSDESAMPTLCLASSRSSKVFSVEVARAGARHWMVSCRDVTAQRDAEREAITLAQRDPLTGLANRQLLTDTVGLAVEESGSATSWLLLLDLDRFKAVNDTLGHPVGDALLKLVARRLKTTLREGDVVARLGGDEFALFVRGVAQAGDIEFLSRRVIDIIGRPYLVDGQVVHVGASLGISGMQDLRDQHQLFRQADLALYAAKNAGRNTYSFFDPAMDARAHMRRSLEIDMRKAVALGELELHYQPQIDLNGHVVTGFEALVRWRHPLRGLVPPAEFIPVAEEIGLIPVIGEWVLRQACADAAQWPETVSLAVNVSAIQFEQADALVASVERALAKSKLPGRRLEIEITESVLMRNAASALDTLHRLRAMGIRIAMDDFGTGYSSLSQLNSFPFDKIKIDRSFVSGQGRSPDRSAIVRAITSLGASLNMATIAEGVETAEELASVRLNGCTSVQGYLFSKPVPVAEIAALMARFSGALDDKAA